MIESLIFFLFAGVAALLDRRKCPWFGGKCPHNGGCPMWVRGRCG